MVDYSTLQQLQQPQNRTIGIKASELAQVEELMPHRQPAEQFQGLEEVEFLRAQNAKLQKALAQEKHNNDVLVEVISGYQKTLIKLAENTDYNPWL